MPPLSRAHPCVCRRALGLTLALAIVAPAYAQEPAPAATRRLDLLEYRLEGSQEFTGLELEAVLTPFLGPDRPLEDVERARAALEKAYSDRGFLAVRVGIPQQRVRDGVVTLKVTEGRVGRLRVTGARWFSLSDIKALAPSVAEGTSPNLNELSRDIVALNQLPDRRVTPELRSGAVPGSVDVDLKVQDTLPLHGLLEFNNRASSGTSPTRLTGSLEYDNLWQLGHGLKFSFQIAPQRLADALVFSAAYTVRFPTIPGLSLMLTGLAQNSDVSTLGGVAVTGRGWLAGAHVLLVLPSSGAFVHTATMGFDFKRFLERVSLSTETLSSGLTYWPFLVQYGASYLTETSQSQVTATLTFNPRGLGNSDAAFDVKRYQARANFVHVRLELARRDRLPGGAELFARANGQYSNDPLIGSEQLISGGAESVRGYFEAQAVGDYGGFLSLELRSPSFAPLLDGSEAWVNDLRLLLFGEGGWSRLLRPLPEQQSIFRLWSAGAGVRLKLFRSLSGSLDVAVPLRTEGATPAFVPRVLFRLWADF